jgi:molybdopterin biosynthesis enzyme MoaB
MLFFHPAIFYHLPGFVKIFRFLFLRCIYSSIVSSQNFGGIVVTGGFGTAAG